MKLLHLFFNITGICLLCFLAKNSFAQTTCPANIGVESGNFTNWQCYTGTVAAVGTNNEITVAASSPNASEHLVYSNVNNTDLDAYGLFPETCPNGSNYSIKLGNNQSGKGAERISYAFTVPGSAQDFSLVYWYAVVFQNPDHQEYQQPRFIASVFDQQSNSYISCASFTYSGSSNLPGFEQSLANREVIFKKWSSVTVNLSGYAGHTIRMEFTTADCTQGGHFGYAYIDINENCSQPIQGATYCDGTGSLSLTAPYGYQLYNWYNTGFTQLLGNSQLLALTPPPPDGTKLAIEVIPYEGFGCKDTVYTSIKKLPAPTAEAGTNTSICTGDTATIGSTANSSLTYQWQPVTAVADSRNSTTTASPATTTLYTIIATDPQSGCTAEDSVLIQVKPAPVAAFIADTSCAGNGVILTNTTTYTGNRPLQCAWLFADGSTSSNLAPIPVFYRPGTYLATLRVKSDECPGTSVAARYLTIVAPPAPKVVNYSTLANEPVMLSTANTGISYSWRPAVFLNTSGIATPIFTGTNDGKYLVNISTTAGCKVTDTVNVKVEKEGNILVPSGFTPNGDGRNERVYPILFAIKQLKYFRIWNRWGMLLYESINALPGWDGQYKGIGQPGGTYVWEAVGLSIANKVINRKGLVILVR